MNAILERVSRALRGARGYRFEGEQANHAEQLRERMVSLNLMANIDPGDPDQVRMASEIEDDAENRLTVLLQRARLTLEEKRERDAIQIELKRRRQSFDSGPVLERRAQAWRPQGLLAPLAAVGAVRPWMLWTGALAAVGAFGLVQTARLTNAKADLREARDLAEQNFDAAQAWRDRSEQYRLHLIDAANVARQAAAALETERAAQARAAARERRRVRDLQNVLTGSPDAPDWRLRDAAASESGPPAGTP